MSASPESPEQRQKDRVAIHGVDPAAPFRGSRCGLCYWALYDGDWCQNKACVMAGKSVGENRVGLTNDEAQILIKAKT